MADEILDEIAKFSSDNNTNKAEEVPPDIFKKAMTAVLSGKMQQSVACKIYNIPRSAFTYVFRKQGLYASRLDKYSNEEIDKIVNSMADMHAVKCSNEKVKTALRRKNPRPSPSSATKVQKEAKNSTSFVDDNEHEMDNSFSNDINSPVGYNFNITKRPLVLLACGAFNPITNMHLRMFELARDYINENFSGFEVERGIISPVSDAYKKKGLLSSTHRINMCNLAIQDNPLLKVSDWEAKKTRWTPTVSVLNYHLEKLNHGLSKDQQKAIMLLCGADFLETFATPGLWENEDITKILKNFGIVVISRKSSNAEKLIYENDSIYSMRESIHLVTNWIENEVSSTKIRRALRRNQSIKYLVPSAVLGYISELELYKDNSEAINEDEELAPFCLNSSQ